MPNVRGAAVPSTVEIYDRIAPGYQRWWAPVIEPAALQLLDLVAEVVVDGPPSVVVDVGAGTGTLARAALARWPGARAVAVDPSPGMLEVGRAEAAAALVPRARRRLRWTLGAAERIPLPDESADLVVSSFAFQYLPSRIAGFREARRVLRPGGAVAVVTWLAADWPFEPWSLYTALIRELQLERPAVTEISRPFRSLPAARTLVRRAGFEQVQATGGVVEKQWTLDAYVACVFESEDRVFIDSLDGAARHSLETLWRQRLARLGPADFCYRDPIGYVTGRRPGSSTSRPPPVSREDAISLEDALEEQKRGGEQPSEAG